MKTVRARATEPSSWAGLGAVIVAAVQAATTESWEFGVATGIAGLAAMVLR